MDFLSKAFANLLVSALFFFATNQAFAAQAGCISKDQIGKIAAHFTQFQNLAGKDYCYDGSNTAYLIEGLMFMQQTTFTSAMPTSHDQLFSGSFTSDWWNYFINRIDELNIQTNCPTGAAAYVTYFTGHTMYVCPLMLTPSFSALDRASIMMHEARHIDGYPHMTCTHGVRKGIQGACDNAITDKGSYAVTVETYAQMGKYATNVNPALMAYARGSAVIYADEAFEQTVNIDREQQFLLMTNDLEFHGFDANAPSKGTSLGHSPAMGQIMVRASYYLIFPDDKTQPATFVFLNDAGPIVQAPGADALAYNQMTPAEKAELVGIHYGGTWGGRVYKSKVSFSCGMGASATELPVTGGIPVSILYPNGYSREAFSTFMQMDNGSVYEFGCTNGKTPFITKSAPFDQIYKQMYMSAGTTVGLTFDGRLFKIANGVSSLIANPYNGTITELAPNQVYGFFGVL